MCFARTIALLMTTSNTLDVFVYGISKIAGAFPPTLAIVGIFIAGMLLNFPINSGSGQMTATMPIMSPLADILHVPSRALSLPHSLVMAGPILFILPMLLTWQRWQLQSKLGRLAEISVSTALYLDCCKCHYADHCPDN